MPISITCSHCESVHDAPDFLAGKRIPCPTCQEIIQIPAESDSTSSFAAPAQPLTGEENPLGESSSNLAADDILSPDGAITDSLGNTSNQLLSPDEALLGPETGLANTFPSMPVASPPPLGTPEISRDFERRKTLTLPIMVGSLLGLVLLAMLVFFLFLKPDENGLMQLTALEPPLADKRAGNAKNLQPGKQNGGDNSAEMAATPGRDPAPDDREVLPPLPPPTSSIEYLTRAISLFQENDFDGAHELLSSAIGKDPRKHQLHYWLGKTLAKQGNLFLARQHLDTAIELDSQNHLYYVLRARLLLPQQPDAANDDLVKAIRINPRFAESFYLQGRVLDELGVPGEAIEAYHQAIDIKPQYTDAIIHRSIDYFALGQNDQALNDINMALSLGAETSILYSIRAQILFDRNDYRAAIDNFDKALERNPDDSAALVFRAISRYHEKQQTDKIESELDRAIEIDPGFSTAYHWRAKVRLESGDLAGAMQDVEEALDLAQHKQDHYDVRAFIYIRMGELDRALEDFNQAIELSPNDAIYYYHRGHLQIRFASEEGEFAERHYALALKDFSRAAKLVPDVKNPAWQWRAKMLLNLDSEANSRLAAQLCLEGKKAYEEDQPLQAKKLFQMARDEDPGYLWAHNNLAFLCATNSTVRDPELAMDAILELARHTPEISHHRFLGTLAVVYGANQQWEGAILYARKAVDNCPPAMEEFYETLLESVQEKERFRPKASGFSLIQ
jgi:tetratricopeptide (TPR) repeat protein